MEKVREKRFGLAVASLVLGGLSLLCCCAYGIGIIFALIGLIFGIICAVSGEGKARVMGIIGLIMSAVGMFLGIAVLVSIASAINWDNVTIENIMQIKNIDPNDSEQVRWWMQQFFKADIGSYVN